MSTTTDVDAASRSDGTKAVTAFGALIGEFKFRPENPTVSNGDMTVTPRRSPRKHVLTSCTSPSRLFVKVEEKLEDLRLLTPRSSGSLSKSLKRKVKDEDAKDVLQALGASESPTKRKRGYAAPEVYAHLNLLPDHLTVELDGELDQRRLGHFLIRF